MAEPIIPHNAEKVLVHQTRVVCDGPSGGRHPRVYLSMVDDEAGEPSHVVCPYCSRVFVYEGVEA